MTDRVTDRPAGRASGRQRVPRLLVLAAIREELGATGEWISATCGVGPVDAAAGAARLIARHRPYAVLHVGIAGARAALGLAPATLVLGTESRYEDLGVPERFAPRVLVPDARLLAAAGAALPDARAMPIGTSGRVGGGSEVGVEAMEGFAVLRAAQLAGVPALELRAISNAIEETDRRRWAFSEAFAALHAAIPAVAAAVAALRRRGPDDA